VIAFCKTPHLPEEQLGGNEDCYCLHPTVIISCKAPHLTEEQLGGKEGYSCLHVYSNQLRFHVSQKNSCMGMKAVTVSVCAVIIMCKAAHLPEEHLRGIEGCYSALLYNDHLP
jgi:hypothetical protein